MPAYGDIKRLVSIIASKREPYCDHGSRTAVYAMKLAMVLELSPEMVQLVEIGAHLHDIGKMLVPAELLNAKHHLSVEERLVIETHAHGGWEIVRDAEYDQVVLNIVRHHHEWWNGIGYPDRLQGNDISTEAQIVGICDVYDALTSRRSYRDAYPHAFAMAFIQKDKWTRFNGDLVDLFFAKVAHG